MSPYITPNRKGKEAAVKSAGFASRYLYKRFVVTRNKYVNEEKDQRNKWRGVKKRQKGRARKRGNNIMNRRGKRIERGRDRDIDEGNMADGHREKERKRDRQCVK